MLAWVVGLTLVGACADQTGDPAMDAMTPWPQDPEELASVCRGQDFPEMATTCWVQVAAKYGRLGRSDDAERVCVALEEGTWQDECHFRAGEELGKAGKVVDALGHCARAGWFGRNCLTHAAWRLPPDPSLDSRTDPRVVKAAGLELLSQVDAVMAGAGDGLEGEGRDLVMARFGHNLYLGTGQTNPMPAHLDAPLGAVLRTGFALETARLLTATPQGASVESILAVYSGVVPPLIGERVPQEPLGRYSMPVLSPLEAGTPHVPLYGGGLRLVGQDADEDMVIAALEALFWLESTPADSFVSWVDDRRERVRWTAARLFRLAKPARLDRTLILQNWAATHPDPKVRWHAQQELSPDADKPVVPSAGVR
jgi:hypothetical protein